MSHEGPKTLRLTSTAAYMRPERQAPTALTTVSTYDSGVGSLQHDQGRELAIAGRRAVQANDMVSNAVEVVETTAVFGPPKYEEEFDGQGNKKNGVSGSTLGASALAATATAGDENTAAGVPLDGLFAATLVACMNEKPPSIDDLAPGGTKKPAAMASPASSPLRKTTAAAASHAPPASPMSPAALARMKLAASQTGPKEPTVKILSPVDKHGQPEAFESLVGILHADPRHGIRSAITTEFFEATNGMRSPQGEWMAATFYSAQKIRPLEGASIISDPPLQCRRCPLRFTSRVFFLFVSLFLCFCRLDGGGQVEEIRRRRLQAGKVEESCMAKEETAL